MKLWEKLPDGVTVDGRRYKCDFDFRNVLRLIEILGRDDMMPEAREFVALRCVMRRPPKDVHGVLAEVKKTLFPDPVKADGPKITDFEQDAGLIRAAFRQAYGIDLYRDKLHWMEFRELLNAIPEGNRYSEVVGIRARPLPVPNKYNKAEREWLIKAKAHVALHLSEKEQKDKYQEDVGKVFAGLMQFFGVGDKENGG